MNTHTDIGNIFTADKIAALAKSADQAQSPQLSDSQQSALLEKIKGLLIEENAVLVAHYYVDGIIQDLAEATGGFVGDSLEMAKFGLNHDAQTVVVAGVRFMGDTAKILSPEKRILMVEMEAECSLDLACGIEEFDAFCDQHPDRTVVVYANTSAAVKARADWVVTSSIAKDVVSHLSDKGDKILWAPDRFLGSYVQKSTGADMVLWDGSCIVHEEFKVDALQKLIKSKPEAKVLVHPESPGDVIDLADVVGSTTQIINAARDLDADTFIVATDQGIFHKMSQLVPGKNFIAAPTAGEGATCVSCAECPWMKLNDLQRLAALLAPNSTTVASSEIIIEEKVRKAAERSIFRMVEFNQLATGD